MSSKEIEAMLKFIVVSLPWKDVGFYQNNKAYPSCRVAVGDYVITIVSGSGEPGRGINPKGWDWTISHQDKGNFNGWSSTFARAKEDSVKSLFQEMVHVAEGS